GKMFYYLNGQGQAIIFLHGWGQNHQTFSKITTELEKDFLVVRLDFLGFGMSDEPGRPLSLDDYVEALGKLIKELNLDNPIIAGHSFGGRVAIRYTKNNPVDKLILISSAGIRKRDMKRFLKVRHYKLKKFFFKFFSQEKYQYLLKKSGSDDYQAASQVMKQTLSKVISEDLRKDLKMIKVKTFLLWGIYDQETPYTEAKIMEEILVDSKLIPFYKSGHFCYLEEEARFIKILKKILLEDDYGNI
ncbi:MAG: alpha/beta hydrolase, partial [Bacilli bacterium]|nr:alpha/beta hydrolase [Bacilli bacterium]